MGVFSDILTAICIFGVVTCSLVLIVIKVTNPIWDVARRWYSLTQIQKFLVAVFIVGMIQYGGTKGWHIGYDGGIKAGANPSYVTNDTIHIEWQRDISHGIYVPADATVYIDYRSNIDTDAEWGLLAQTTVGAWSWDGSLRDATNYNYNVWAYYIPPEPVHTNGVWVYKTFNDRGNRCPIPLLARIEINGKAIATPKEKRNDEKR